MGAIAFYRVKHTNKWEWDGEDKQNNLATVIYNGNMVLQNMPIEANGYVVNGKSSLESVVERQIVETERKSRVADDYANEAAVIGATQRNFSSGLLPLALRRRRS